MGYNYGKLLHVFSLKQERINKIMEERAMNISTANANEVPLTRLASPPGSLKTEAEEPPACRSEHFRKRFFPHVPNQTWDDWKWQFRNRITTVEQLAKLIFLSSEEQERLKFVTSRYPLSITPYYLSLINRNDPDDPIKKQAVPSFEETSLAGIGQEDPLAEKEGSVVPGLVHRYPDRVLMVLTNICPVFCRHCTRKREWQYGGWVRPFAEIERMLEYIQSTQSVRDVIISGGDCLTLSTGRLEKVLMRLRQIEHVEIIRIGTRFPVVLPQRINNELCSMLSQYGPIWLNTHFKHPKEITPAAAAACDRLLRSGIPVNNQSVLLRGINDSVEIQTKLCHGLLKIKVRPYYLFHTDDVEGTEHLRTSIETGINIVAGMRGHTSGLAIPSFVVDLPGGGGKVLLQPDYLISGSEDEYIFRNYQGRIFRCRNPLQADGSEFEGNNVIAITP